MIPRPMIHRGSLGKADYTAQYSAESLPGTVCFTAPTQKAQSLYIPADLVLQVAAEIQARRVLADLEAKR